MVFMGAPPSVREQVSWVFCHSLQGEYPLRGF
jgi:hypothetical protein